MKTSEDLKVSLDRIDGRGYKAYKDISGEYTFEKYTLCIDHVQGDPFATPSRMRIRVPQDISAFPEGTYGKRSRKTALCDFITRLFYQASRKHCKGARGTGNSGLISIVQTGQEILSRSSAAISDSWVEARFSMGLPAFGRRIAARTALSMFFEEVPRIVSDSLFYKNLDRQSLYRHIQTAEDADFLRDQLGGLGLAAFVADGAVLPRASGVDMRPLTGDQVVPFLSPESLRVEVTLPNRGALTGMGIPNGVTLIVGGGYHGKSTLLKALERGVYNHIPGDGREFVVTNPSAVKIRSEDGRSIRSVNISPFIANLPFGLDTKDFSSDDASGSTSQAANIMEALEVGAQVFLIDEDTSATNFMIRDHRMQELVSKSREPITPFIDKIRQLYSERKVSTILVMGGSGDYFDVADCVICMVNYRPEDVTQKARAIAEKYRAERMPEGGRTFGEVTDRIPLSRSFDPSKGKKRVKISAKGRHSLLFGVDHINLSAVEQIVDQSQVRAIGDAIHYATSQMAGGKILAEVTEKVIGQIREKGLDVLSRSPKGDYAEFRGFELAAAINRLRSIQVTQKER